MLQQQTVLFCSYEVRLFPFLAASLIVKRQLCDIIHILVGHPVIEPNCLGPVINRAGQIKSGEGVKNGNARLNESPMHSNDSFIEIFLL